MTPLPAEPVDPPGGRVSVGDSGCQWLLWQLADSAFPAGGFAHSGGLEAAFHQNELRHFHQLEAFINASLCQIGHAMLPFTTAAHGNPDGFLELDRLCDSFTTNHVANRASRLQGKAMVGSSEQAFGTPELRRLRQAASSATAFCHLAPVFGVITRTLAIPEETASRLFLYVHLRGLVSAAVRLGIVGPLQGQSLQYSLAPRVEQILQRCRQHSIHDIAQTAPLLELWQANQDRLYSRLFQS